LGFITNPIAIVIVHAVICVVVVLAVVVVIRGVVVVVRAIVVVVLTIVVIKRGVLPTSYLGIATARNKKGAYKK
jgi:hypothetical protein